MSEEILRALTQLFAIIASQDDGSTNREREHVIHYFHQELDQRTVEEYVALYDQYIEEEEARRRKNMERQVRKLQAGGEEGRAPESAVSVRSSVRTLSIGRKINTTLDQRQKVIVLGKLLEMVASDAITTQRMEIIHTVAEVFNIPSAEFRNMERFATEHFSERLDQEDILLVCEQPPVECHRAAYQQERIDGELLFLRMRSVGLYFLRYQGANSLLLNGQPIASKGVYLFSQGSILKMPKGAPIYYGDLVNRFNADISTPDISFVADHVHFSFPNGTVGLRDICISERSGTLVGIMGSSGAGKTTLLNVMAGLDTPSQGEVRINGLDVAGDKEKLEGVIGYVSQDDLLIEELTVFENLYYNAKLCFKSLGEQQICAKVDETLDSLGLAKIKDLPVGSVLNKKISGGQRKRLNIALELIREPAVLFVDEPTSGLSSRDSENVIDLLKELSLRGKLVFVVIHQPSSDIYKTFDKLYILDTGGYPIFYGHPVEAITYFKSAAKQVDSDKGQCHTCGNVNPEQVFNIIEALVVDEYGKYTNKRKKRPEEWNKRYQDGQRQQPVPEEVYQAPPKTLDIPSRLRQLAIFSARDLKAKLNNLQYMVINLLEAPMLALLLSWVIKFSAETENGEYVFRHNENLPAYILISILVALFMGLTVSAEEIIRDRKILKRERFLNLSRSSYLLSKLLILFGLSGLQTLCFVLVGNSVLQIEGMNLAYWLMLFTVSCHANILGLNISSGFNSAITVYILIPILLIPQMVLSGLIFDFSKLNASISQPGKTPLMADMMASRWAYEGLAVHQHTENAYSRSFFDLDQRISAANYKVAYWEPRLQEVLLKAQEQTLEYADSLAPALAANMALLRHEVGYDAYFRAHPAEQQKILGLLQGDRLSALAIDELRTSLDKAVNFYSQQMVRAQELKDEEVVKVQHSMAQGTELLSVKDANFNDELDDLVKSAGSLNMTALSSDRIVQLVDPIYHVREDVDHPVDYRSHFFAPRKYLFGKFFDTYYFDVLAVWVLSALLYVSLYFELLARIISAVEGLGKRLSNRFGSAARRLTSRKAA